MFRITQKEARTLAIARGVLTDLEARITKAALADKTMDRMDALSLGQLREAVDTAENAIFNALNTASSHLEDPVAKQWVHARSAAAPPADPLA